MSALQTRRFAAFRAIREAGGDVEEYTERGMCVIVPGDVQYRGWHASVRRDTGTYRAIQDAATTHGLRYTGKFMQHVNAGEVLEQWEWKEGQA